ncbi:MAG: hypothetical protein DSY70_02815 [Desulfobulbus sp.]|nr:MAG: hypothetical protein DSY70_02815 [Desulfobulbus sp.]
MAVSRKTGGFIGFLLIAIVVGWFSPLWAESYFFVDEFEGPHLNSSIWKSEQVRGRRWCGEEENGFAPGTWVSIASTPCYSTLQPPPYGSIEISEDGVHLNSLNEYVFPYFFTGPSSHLSPFPPTGDFSLEIRLRHDYIGVAGNGVYIRFWDDNKPEGENPPIIPELRVFSIWSDTNSSRIGLLGESTEFSDIPGLFNVYRLEYRKGQYSAFINDILVAGPIKSELRPNTIWVGNPLALWWIYSGEAGWSAFTIDYIRVSKLNRQDEEFSKIY